MDFAYLTDFFLNLDQHLESFTQQYGLWVFALLALVIFCETGLVVMPFLPGDVLLFIAGAVAAQYGMNPWLLGICLFFAAVLGDSTNYWIGRRYGIRLFTNTNARLFRRDYLLKTEIFYARHGAKTVTLARFFAVLRTFAPFVAGISRMPYPRFLKYSVFGSVLWIGGLVGLGYLFGRVPIVRDNLNLLIFSVIGISLLAILAGYMYQRRL
jgi:membrane-associated protein